jgi:ABC-type amino acid transport system permease subunit
MFRETRLLFTVAVVELIAPSQFIPRERYRLLEPIILVGMTFLSLSYPAALLIRRIELRHGKTHVPVPGREATVADKHPRLARRL